MYKKLLAVIAAAACAAVIVGFIPAPHARFCGEERRRQMSWPPAKTQALRREHRDEGSGAGGAGRHLHARLAALRAKLSPRQPPAERQGACRPSRRHRSFRRGPRVRGPGTRKLSEKVRWLAWFRTLSRRRSQ